MRGEGISRTDIGVVEELLVRLYCVRKYLSSRTNLRSNLCLVVSVGVCCELAKCTDKMVLVTTPFGSEEDLDPWGRWAKIQPRYTNEIVPRTGIEGNVGGACLCDDAAIACWTSRSYQDVRILMH